MINEEISKYDSTLDSLKEMLKNQKDANLKKTIQAFMLPLIEALREESMDAFEIMQERIEDLEEEGINAKLEKLANDALPVIESLMNVLTMLMVKHGYLIDGNYVTDADEAIKNAHLLSQTNMISWLQAYRAYEESGEASEDEEDEDSGEEEQEENKAA